MMEWTGVALILALAIFSGSAPKVEASESAAIWSQADRVVVLVAFAAPVQAEHIEEEHATAEHEEAAVGEHGAAEEHGAGEEHSLLTEIFHWLNFLVLLGALAYLLKKLLIPFLAERGRAIREDMDRSARALADADQRLSAVEAKMKSMDAEMTSLRQAALRESDADRDRIEQAATAEAEKVLAMADQEIVAAVKTARQDLKVFTSELALGLAEKNIRSSLTPVSEQRILRNFVKGLSTNEPQGNGQTSGTSSQGRQE
jgi:F-type H+-transporting ATPase subunit b